MLFQVVGFIFGTLHLTGGSGEVSAWDALVSELAAFLTVAIAVAVMAKVEERRVLDYNLRARTGWLTLAAAGGWFLALSALVGVLAWGHWLTFGAVSLSVQRLLNTVRCGELLSCWWVR